MDREDIQGMGNSLGQDMEEENGMSQTTESKTSSLPETEYVRWAISLEIRLKPDMKVFKCQIKESAFYTKSN